MDNCKLMYMLLACLVAAMFLEIGMYMYNRRTDLRKVKNMVKYSKRR